jgi:hypothetical protein
MFDRGTHGLDMPVYLSPTKNAGQKPALLLSNAETIRVIGQTGSIQPYGSGLVPYWIPVMSSYNF